LVEAIKSSHPPTPFCPSDEYVPPIKIVVNILIAKDGDTKR
jgi:hypothetical protein